MKQKCQLCETEIPLTFLDKLKGTMIKIGSGETAKKVYVCSSCQKEHKENLKKKILKQ